MKIASFFAAVSMLFISLTAARANTEETKNITLRFIPKDGLTFNYKVTSLTKKKYYLLTMLGGEESQKESPKEGKAGEETGGRDLQIEEAVSKIKVVVKKIDSGWEMKFEPMGIIMKKDNTVIRNPGMNLFSGFTFAYKLDRQGKIEDVTGFDQVETLIAAKYPAEKAKKVSTMIHNDKIKEKEISEWNARVGDFVGKTVHLGEVWESDIKVEVPSGDEITCKSRITFKALERCGLTECLKIEQTYDNKAALIARASKEQEKKSGEAKDETDGKAKEPKIMVEATLTRLIEPDTMLLYREELERTILLDSAFMSKERVPTTINEKRVLETEYL